MPRNYRHIQEYETEIISLKKQGKTLREIGGQFGFTYEQVHNFISRYNVNQRKLEAGIALKRKGRPPKDSVVSEQDKVTEPNQYKQEIKEAKETITTEPPALVELRASRDFALERVKDLDMLRKKTRDLKKRDKLMDERIKAYNEYYALKSEVKKAEASLPNSKPWSQDWSR